MVYNTINKDLFLQIYAEDYARFRVLENNITIYEGKVYPKPGTDYADINLSKIVENYITQSLPANYGQTSASIAYLSNAYKEFELDILSSGGTWSKYDDYGFLFWFDYDANPSSYTDLVLNDPVNNHSTSGARYVRTRLAQGVVTNLINVTSTVAGYDESYCGQYGITYLNKRGGYDFFLFEGKCSKSEDYEIFKYNRTYDNNHNGFGSSRYQNITTPRYQLSTGWLTDEESKKFAKHIVGSNQVWLQDFNSGKTIPVVITNTSVDYKTFNNNKMVCYTLDVANSQEEYRK